MRSYGPTSKPLRSPVTHPIRKRAVRPGVVQNRTQTPQPFGTPHRVLPNADISEIGLRTQRPPSLQAGRPFKGRGVAGWSFTRCRSQSLQKKQLERTTRKWVYTLSLLNNRVYVEFASCLVFGFHGHPRGHAIYFLGSFRECIVQHMGHHPPSDSISRTVLPPPPRSN